MSEHIVSLTNLNQGAAIEMFDAELKKVVENIADLNTTAKVKREITLKVVFVPNDERTQGLVGITVASKLAGHRGTSTTVWFGKKSGERLAVETDPSPGLFDQGRKLNMVPITDKETAK
jgi:hypothetical protein